MRPQSCRRPPGFSCRVGRTCGQHSPDARTFEDQVRAYSLGGSPTFKLPFSLLWTPTGVKTGCVCRAPGSVCHLGHGVQSRQGPGGGWTVGRWPPPTPTPWAASAAPGPSSALPARPPVVRPWVSLQWDGATFSSAWRTFSAREEFLGRGA